MKLENIIAFLEKKYKPDLAEKWDNSGLILGRKEKKIYKILTCLDITNEIVKQAVNGRVDLIISHHPLIFSEIKKITGDTILGEKLLDLIENNIAVYSIHTNADSALGGLNDFILEKICLEGKKDILFINENDNIAGLGRSIVLKKEMNIQEIIKTIKEKLGLKFLRISGENNKNIKKIAVLTGSGGSLIPYLKKDIDLYITGDLKHHETLDGIEAGYTLIDLGHYESEIIFSELMEKDLKNFFDGEVLKAVENQVFKIV